MTQDTHESIANKFSNRPTFRVTMTDGQLNQWVEDDYEGYGVFGGKDYYELLDEMNGGTGDRMRGIDIAFGKKPFKAPSLSRCGAYYNGDAPEDCPDQGCFYDVNF